MKPEDVKRTLATFDKVWDSEENAKRRKDMDKYLEHYTGEYWRNEEAQNPQDSGIFVNLVFSTVMTIAPLLTDNEPIWAVTARKPYWQKVADLFKSAGDSLYASLGMSGKIFDLVLDALVMKTGWIKVHFDPDAKEIGELALSIVDPRTYIQAPGYTDPWEAPWCGTKTRMTLSEIRTRWPENGHLVKPNEGETDIDSDFGYTTKTANIREIFFRNDIALLEIDAEGTQKDREKEAEIYKNGRILVLADGLEEPLEDKPYPYNHGKCPYVPFYDYKVPHSAWGMGEVENMETLEMEYNLLVKKLSAYCRKWLLDPDVYMPADWTGDVETWKEKAPGGGNVWPTGPSGEIPKIPEISPINQTVIQFLQSLPQILAEITGVNEMTKGNVSKKQRQSAREIAILAETSNTRTRQRVRNLEWTLIRVYTLMIELMMQYYTEPRTYSRRTGDAMEWVNVSSKPAYLAEILKPQEYKPDPEMSEEESAKEQALYQQDYKDYTELVKAMGDESSIHMEFEVSIDTNSTLPMDKQSLVAEVLNLAQIQLTPNSPVDAQFIHEILRLPGKDRLLKRIKERLMAAQQPQGAPGGAPIPVPGGMNG